MNPQPNDDFTRDVSATANIGKRFYTWATLGTFAGATFIVSGVWQTLQGFGLAVHTGWPLLFSAVVIIAFAFATEPKSQKTSRAQKTQKAIITLANTLLVYFTVIGATGIIKSPSGPPVP